MKRFLVALALVCTLPFSVRASEPIYISEVAWAASSLSTADEWLEVCGPPGADLSGWAISGAATGNGTLVIPAGSFIPESGAFLISNYGAEDPKSALANAPDMVTTGVALSNSSLWLGLYDPSDALIDAVGASGTAPLAGMSGSIKASMERVLPLMDGGVAESWLTATTSLGFDIGAYELGTPGTCPTAEQIEEENAAPETEPALPEDSATTTQPTVPETPPDPDPMAEPVSNPPIEAMSAVRISEAYPAPLSGEREWIELVNPSATGELLDGWTIEDGKGTATKLSGLILPWDRIVIEAPKGSLNNDGDLVILKDARGRIVDGVAYGSWETALYPRVGEIKKGFSLIRIELQDAFDITEAPTRGAANILIKETRSDAPPVTLSTAKDPLSSIEHGADPSVALRSVQDDKVAMAAPAKAALSAPTSAVKKASASAAKKAPASKYKGDAYTAVILVPPGVYSKTKLYVMQNGTLREMRLSQSTTAKFEAGARIAFIAQEKEEKGETHLLANPKSVRALDTSASTTFATIESWPQEAGAYRFSAEIIAARSGILEVRVGGIEGDVLLPTAMASLKAGDLVTVEGFIAPGVRPRVVLPGASSVTLKKPARSAVSSTGNATPQRLPLPLTVGLTAVAALAGLAAYLRNERLKRLSLLAEPIEEEA